MDEAATRAVDVGYEKERDGDDQGQNKKYVDFALATTRAIADQQVTADGDRYH